ncbi:hypothetical protein [Paenibacillus xylanexedens]|uniref:hypothetical protein n=1 Tax=Paenibacillus xylanexedens TaxID=528191 RepID=UPI000F546CD7|nr:hypothetical protein [Paenibacillus xylanexedens]RPK29384.1 hypothetical protein EDO6_00007 [Paenibacillus xylanexedens]
MSTKEDVNFEEVVQAFKDAHDEYSRIVSSMVYLYDLNKVDISKLSSLIQTAKLKVSKLSGEELDIFNTFKSEYDYAVTIIDELMNTIVTLRQ